MFDEQSSSTSAPDPSQGPDQVSVQGPGRVGGRLPHPGLAEAGARMHAPLRERALRGLLDRHLQPGEGVAAVALGAHAGGRGLVALTDHRVVFTEERIGIEELTVVLVESFDLEDITEVAWTRHGSGGTLTVRAASRCAQLRRVTSADGAAVSEALRERLSPRPRLLPARRPAGSAGSSGPAGSVA